MQFVKAVRENVGLLIGLAGSSGSGKTFSALRLASGIAQGKPFAFIDTENKRGLHYADQFNFHHGDLRAPFEPKAYAQAIKAADEAGYPVIVVDSMTHEWAGEGGVLEMYEEDFHGKFGGKDTCKMLAWHRPKGDHKKMVQRMLQVRAHLILCFRAEEKIEMGKKDGKTVIGPKAGLTGLDGWFPVCEKNLPYELTASFLLMAQNPGIPLKIKLQEQHKPLFPAGQLIDENAGRRIAEWAAGGKISPAAGNAGQPPSQSTVKTPAQQLGARWGRCNIKGKDETREAYQARFLSWATAQAGITINSLNDLDEEAIDRCNIVLDDIEAASAA